LYLDRRLPDVPSILHKEDDCRRKIPEEIFNFTFNSQVHSRIANRALSRPPLFSMA